MKPKEIVEKWVKYFNAGDVQGIASLYHEDAINHQVANEPVVGREKIQAMFESEFANADMTCIVENILKKENGPYSNGKTHWD